MKDSEKPLAAAFYGVGMDAASGSGSGIVRSARWLLRLLGDFQLNERASGEKVAVPGKRERVLLAYLALSPNGRQPRRKLVTLLWGEAADETTLENLRTAIFNLRKALGDTEHVIIASEDRDIVLDTSAFQVDVLEFRRLSAGGTTSELEEAAKLYSGDFLDGLSIESEEYESWRREESTRCKGQALDALTKLMGQFAAAGENERAIETGLRILRLEPLHEAAARSLMRLYAESGRRAAAVELYRTLAESLKKELGAQPEAETRAVYAEITQGNDGRTAATADAKPPLASPTTAHPSARAEHSPGVSIAPPKKRTIGWIAAGAVAAVAAIAILSFISLAPSTAPTGGPPTVVAATSNSAIALAVLPFANLSTEPDQEFFSDGLTDEIASALARVPDLRIVARTSAFEFKGQNRNITAIGEQLGATHLIEGSVRRAGDRVRVTLQLIRADDGTRIWSDDYDRQLTDIFAIQEDIARAVASSLSVPLGLQQGENLVSNRSIDPASYQQYLQARAIFRGRAQTRFTEAIALLEQVVARDPDFAPAWALLADGYDTVAFTGEVRSELRQTRGELRRKAQMAAERAIQLDPNLPDGYVPLGTVQIRRGNLLLGEELISKALALDPDHPDALASYGNLLVGVGHLKEALASSQKLRLLEPFAPEFDFYAVWPSWLNGQTDAAIALLDNQPPGPRARVSAMIHASEGRYGEAATVLSETASSLPPDMLEATIRLLRTAPAPQSLPRFEFPVFVYLHAGAADRVLEFYEDLVQGESLLLVGVNGIANLWHRSYAPVRKAERFKAFVRNAGLVEYWRAKGWPDLCRPLGADDFVCE